MGKSEVKWWERVDWPGAIAFVLALGVAAGFFLALFWITSPWTPELTDESATLLSTLGGAMIGAVATYLGSTVRANVNQEARDKEAEHAASSEKQAANALSRSSGRGSDQVEELEPDNRAGDVARVEGKGTTET